MGAPMLKDEQILYDALARYAEARAKFAQIIQLDIYRTPEGEKPAQAEIDDAIAMAEQCARLADRAKEKMDSPIIILQ